MFFVERELTLRKFLFLILYYGFFRFLPESNTRIRFVGKVSRRMRGWCCKHIFFYCGPNVNIHRKAHFGKGDKISIGANSGIGENCSVPNGTTIGDNVMMGPNCLILSQNHKTDRTDIPMIEQGMTEVKPCVIEDDVWIGINVTMTPGRHIRKGTIIAAGTVLCKDFSEYSVVGGNPSRLIKSRLVDG